MMRMKAFSIGDLFDLTPGKFHATSELDPGSVPLISCGEENNGLIGHFDIADQDTHERALTVAFNGFPLTTNFHPYRFGAKDDVAVLVPKEPMNDPVLIYVASMLNAMRWRYSYGRKCYREKLRNVEIQLPVARGGIDDVVPAALLVEAQQRIQNDTRESLARLLGA
jgi:hypothetical protein